jgi:transmembrane sensor
LEPGQQVQYKKKSSQFSELQEFNIRSVYSWKDGILYFKSAGLSEVITRLERWYGVEFIIGNNSSVPWSYTGEFNNQSLKSVLESLSFSQNFNFTINDKNVTIHFNN